MPKILHTTALLLALCSSLPAAAQEFNLHVETAAAFWVDQPQISRFTPGFAFAVRPSITMGRLISLQASYALYATPPHKPYTEFGAAHEVLLGVRVRPLATLRPPTENLGGLFVDTNFGWVRTGKLARFGFDVGLGYDFQVAPSFALGPVVRYAQIVQPDKVLEVEPRDGQLITVGVDFAFGPAYKEPPAEVAEPVYVPVKPDCPQVETPTCPDADHDLVCDVDDQCPDKPGPASTMGCPIDPCSGAPLVVLVQFDQDSSGLPRLKSGTSQTMDPVLDAVARAIAQDPTCRVCIVGHASEEGTSEYNLALSARRATAVQGYLAERGVSTSRMPTLGLGEECNLAPAQSLSLNRRVEFRRLYEGEDCPAACEIGQAAEDALTPAR